MTWIRATLVVGLLTLLAWCLAPAGPLALAPSASAAEGEGETTTTPAEEPPPVVVTPPPVETPTETPATPVETPTSTPSETPSVESGTTTTESSRPSSSGSTGTSVSGGGSSTSPSSSGTTTTSSGTVATHRATHIRATPTHTSNGNSAGSNGGSGGGSKANGGNNGSSNGGDGGRGGSGGDRQTGSRSGGSRQPSVSPQGINEGATAVSHVAAHVGEAFAEAIPTAPLKKVGTRLAAHLDLIPKQDGVAQKKAVDRIGTALGAALIGSAVAVERTSPSHSPIPFFEPPGGKSGTIYLILIAVLLLAVAALLFREVRSALGLTGPRTGVRVADQRPRIGLSARAEIALERMRESSDRSRRAFRRMSANAVHGVRSLF